ncbi:DUF488 domain-containing protein [Ottowia thiooxydans]|uniref:DUF488 domain-containing protein n=1 Tax=Ottowia thiooxydans TaxID=219182 RepID=UPI00048B4C7B|nr:DUF488 family protein [Ottowia thiooxydans]
MSIRIVRLGTPRAADEGVRIGTVRRPPRGVPKTEFASGDWYDVWYPNLSPSPDHMKLALGTHTEPDAAKAAKDWTAFTRLFRREMSEPDAARTLDVLASLSHGANFSVGCYCAEEARCHRSILRALLAERGADLV